MNNDTIVRYGFNHGQDLVACNFGDIKITEDMEYNEYLDAIRELAWEAEDNYRQYTPFEFFAQELNDSEDPDEAWDTYETAMSEGIEKELLTLTEVDFNNAKDVLFGDDE